MDETEFDALYGQTFCKYFGYSFIKEHLRIDITIQQLDKEILRNVVVQEELATHFLSSKFWIHLVDKLDSRFTVKRDNIKSNITWQKIAERFFKYIYPNNSRYKLNNYYTKKLTVTIDSIFTENKFSSVNDLLEHLNKDFNENLEQEQSIVNEIDKDNKKLEEQIIQYENNVESNNDEASNIKTVEFEENKDEAINSEANSVGIDTVKQIEANEVKNCNNNSIDESDSSIKELVIDFKNDKDSVTIPLDDLNGSINSIENSLEFTNKDVADNALDDNANISNKITTTIERSFINIENQDINESENNQNNLSFQSETTIIDFDIHKQDYEIISNNSDDQQSSSLNQQILDSDSIDKPNTTNENRTSRKRTNIESELDKSTEYSPMKKSKYFILNDNKLKVLNKHDSIEMKKRIVLDMLNKKNPDTNALSYAKGKVKLRPTDNKNQIDDEWLEVPETISNESAENSTTNNLIFPPQLSNQATFYPNKAKHAYSIDEDKAILNYIIKNQRYADLKGNQVWKEMEENHVCFGRSWQSMKERFRKSIIQNLSLYAEMFSLSPQELDYIQTNVYYTENQTSKTNTESDVQGKPANISKALGNNYSVEEDEEILKFVFSLESHDSLLGKLIWTKIAKFFRNHLNRPRSWQSLRERFLKRILPKIYNYENLGSYDKTIKIIEECSRNLRNKENIKQKIKEKFNIKEKNIVI